MCVLLVYVEGQLPKLSSESHDQEGPLADHLFHKDALRDIFSGLFFFIAKVVPFWDSTFSLLASSTTSNLVSFSFVFGELPC